MTKNAAAEETAPAETPQPEAKPRYGIEHYQLPSGGHRVKIGPAEEVPDKSGEGTHLTVAAPVLISNTFEKKEELGLAVAETLMGVNNGAQLIGQVPDALAVWALAPPPVVANVAPAEHVLDIAPAQDLQHFDGSVMDRRQVAVLCELDRRHDHFVDRRAYRIWRHVVERKTISEAVAETNRMSAGSGQARLTDVEGWTLARNEAYRLAYHILQIEHRSLMPTQPT